jgi:tetratricopeptide (TPR) repeat protein
MISATEKRKVYLELCGEGGPFAGDDKYCILFREMLERSISEPKATLKALARTLYGSAGEKDINRVKQRKLAAEQALTRWYRRNPPKTVYAEFVKQICLPMFRRIGEGPQPAAVLEAEPHHSQDAVPDAVDGRLYLQSWDGRRTTKAIEHFKSAIDADPKYAPAYAGLAESLGQLAYWAQTPPCDLRPKAVAAAQGALRAAPGCPDSHWAMGSIAASFDGDNALSEQHFKKALRLDRRNAMALSLCATTLLAPMGHAAEALSAATEAVRNATDGSSAYHRSNLGWANFYAGDFQNATKEWDESVKRFPTSYSPRYGLACAYGELSRWEEAFALFEELIREFPEQTELTALDAYYHARAGIREEAHERAASLVRPQRRYVPSLCQALADLARSIRKDAIDSKMFEQAFRHLEIAYQEGDIRLRWVEVNPVFQLFRKHQRYPRLIKSLGLI